MCVWTTQQNAQSAWELEQSWIVHQFLQVILAASAGKTGLPKGIQPQHEVASVSLGHRPLSPEQHTHGGPEAQIEAEANIWRRQAACQEAQAGKLRVLPSCSMSCSVLTACFCPVQGKQGKGAQSRKHQSQHQHVELPHDLPDEAPELTAEDEALVDEYDFSFLDTMDREALDR